MMIKYIKRYKLHIFLIILLVFIQSITLLYLPKLMGNIVDNGVAMKNINYIIKMGFIMLLITFASSIASICNNYVSTKVSVFIAKDIRTDLFQSITSFNIRNFEKIETSSLITRTTNDVTQIQNVLSILLRIFLKVPLLAIGAIIMAILTDAKLSLVLIILIGLIGIFLIFVSKIALPLFKGIQIKKDGLNQLLRERLNGIRVIRAFNNEEYEEKRFSKLNVDLTNTMVKINRILGLLMPLMILIMSITSVIVLYFGTYRVDSGVLLVGNLMSFIQYVMQIMISFAMLGMLFVLLPRASVSMDRIKEVMNIKNEVVDGHVELTSVDTIRFDHVYFSYNEKPVLKDISFTVNKGEVVGILGGTGSGKSTLISLIPRLYRVSEGRIKINDVDINEYTNDSLRNKIGFTLQKTNVFKGSVKENLDFNNKLNIKDINEAVDISQSREFLLEKENLDTELSKGGNNLSGGQKQRISIARTLAKNPDIYIFDDSFSALDLKTEKQLKEELDEKIKGKITFIVSQKISTVRNADKIILLDKGKVVGIGVHDELLQSSEIYREIMDSQEVAYE